MIWNVTGVKDHLDDDLDALLARKVARATRGGLVSRLDVRLSQPSGGGPRTKGSALASLRGGGQVAVATEGWSERDVIDELGTRLRDALARQRSRWQAQRRCAQKTRRAFAARVERP